MLLLQFLYEIVNKTIESFNNNCNLNLNKDCIIGSLVNKISVHPPINEMIKLMINVKCMVIKKSNCSYNCIPGHIYFVIHLRFEGKLPLPEHVKRVSTKYKYEIIANTVSLGNE